MSENPLQRSSVPSCHKDVLPPAMVNFRRILHWSSEGQVGRLAVEATGGDSTRVLAGTDCGFDTSAGSNRVDKGLVWLKLRSMREGADIASRELF